MKTYQLENGKYLGISYFTKVDNMKLLKANMMSIFKDKSPVLINHRLIVDPFQILVATNNAYSSIDNSSMKTRCLATEILFNLSSSKSIKQSLEDVGAKDQDDSAIVAIVSKFPNVPEMKIFHDDCIKESEITDFSFITENIDEYYIKSYYGISEIECENSNILDSIVSRIACKHLI